MNSELKNIQEFFTERRLRCISVRAIELEANIPAKTLTHFLKGRRQLNSDHIQKLIPVLMDFGYKANWFNMLTNGCMCSVLPCTYFYSKHKNQLAKLTYTTCYRQLFIINFKNEYKKWKV